MAVLGVTFVVVFVANQPSPSYLEDHPSESVSRWLWWLITMVSQSHNWGSSRSKWGLITVLTAS